MHPTSTDAGPKLLRLPYGVTETTICDIAKRKTWRHI